MIVEERTYTLHPGKLKEYMNRFEHDGSRTYLSSLSRVIGVFTTEVGTLNQVVTIVAYENFEARAAQRMAMRELPEWESYGASVRPLIVKQENRILLPASFSPIR
jgi:hypothetical protein